MTPGRYAEVPYPWRALLDVGAPAPARQYAAIILQTLRYGLPARRRAGAFWAFVGRRDLPAAPVAAVLRRLPARPRPDLDALREDVLAHWPELASRSARLPARPPALSLLSLERAAARTVFVLGDAPRPLLVLKLPRADAAGVDREVAALRQAGPAGLGPLELGRLGEARVQEGLPGAPLLAQPLPLRDAERVAWPRELDDVCAGLARLAEATVKPGGAATIRPAVELALGSSLPAAAARRALAAAWRDVARIETSVLRHRDTSPQNCLVQEGRLTGIVDWEMAQSDGMPGFDALNSALAYLEYGLGLVRWSEELVVEAFRRSWSAPGYWPAARAAARATAEAGGVGGAALEALEVVFFGSRVGDRLARPGWHPTGPATAARALEVVCS